MLATTVRRRWNQHEPRSRTIPHPAEAWQNKKFQNYYKFTSLFLSFLFLLSFSTSILDTWHIQIFRTRPARPHVVAGLCRMRGFLGARLSPKHYHPSAAICVCAPKRLQQIFTAFGDDPHLSDIYCCALINKFKSHKSTAGTLIVFLSSSTSCVPHHQLLTFVTNFFMRKDLLWLGDH